jgi:hypothetical protein
MVRNAARSEETRRAAALTPSTPSSFVPSRKGSSSGLFDVRGIATHVNGPQAWSSVSAATPSLILPITGPGVEEATRSRSAHAALPPIPVLPRRRKEPPKPTPWERVSDVASMLGFAAAWIATTGLGAVVVAALMTREQAPPPSLVGAGGPPGPAPVCDAPPSCPRTWEPPLVAVTDLPIAPRRGAVAPVWAQAHEPTPAPPPAVPVVAVAPRHFESAPVAAAKKPEGPPAVTLRPARAKTVTAPPAGPPHSLEDWIRRAVSTDAKQPH